MAGLILVLLATIGIAFWWLRLLTLREQRRRAALLQGSSVLRPAGEHWSRAQGIGQIVLLVIGSYAARRLPAILHACEMTGTRNHIGPILVAELDADVRQQCLAALPPAYLDRVVTVDSALLPAGLLGDTVQEVLAARHLWENELAAATRHWFNRIEREARPALLLTLLSPGGHAALGLPVLHSFSRRFPRIPVYLTTLLDGKRVVRKRFPDIFNHLRHAGLVRGTILLDNLRDNVRGDLGISVLFGGMAAAAWSSTRPTELWNALAHLFPREEAGSLATISVVAETLPVYHLPARYGLPELYYTRTDLVEEKICRAVQSLIEQPALQSVPLEPAATDRLRVIYIVAPLRPEPDLKELAMRVEQALAPWRATYDGDLIIQIASAGVPLAADSTVAPLVAVLLQPLSTDEQALTELARSGVVDPRYRVSDPSRPEAPYSLGQAARSQTKEEV